MEYDIDKLVSDMDFVSSSFVTCNNGLMLTNKEVEVLRRYKIDYESCIDLKEVLRKIDEVFSETEDAFDLEDLDSVSLTIAERDYYQNTNK